MGWLNQINETRHTRWGGGFTLPEMIVVMIITAILAVTAAPSILNLGTSRCSAAARQLVRDLTFARQRSIATGTRHWIVFNTSTQTWSILAENPASPGRAGATALTDLATGSAFAQRLNFDAFLGVSMTSVNIGSGSEVGFDWRGKPLNSSEADLASDGTVSLTGSSTVTINANTGYATTP